MTEENKIKLETRALEISRAGKEDEPVLFTVKKSQKSLLTGILKKLKR